MIVITILYCLFIAYAIIGGATGMGMKGGQPAPIMLLLGVVLFCLLIWDIFKNKSKKEQENLVKSDNIDREQIFTKSRTIGDIIIDDVCEMFYIKSRPEYFNFSEIQNFKMYQDNVTVASGSTGAALNVGGMIIGGMDPVSSSVEVEKIDVVFNSDGKNAGRYTLSILKRSVKQNSEEYRLAIEEAETIAEFFGNLVKE
ncbi:hypothetical protein [Enterococcus sp. N249-2]